ncbi:DegV family protein [Neobacillus vireti]|uniref:DegV family protein n=1 Tax=Neobacillus vireti LMG 21834 TaxID=1131730 RepID=A0AB94IN64_9BACI|nr:DegV family protein [Neobacillus vireti]ETI68459.1 DegV family protein [Neobacillus vireti LMG 21834]KLT17241.1 fatty acid-binding protein DegV [Neobacillus vireti]
MVKTAWVTDSTAFLDEELRNHPDIYTIPLTILLDGEEFSDGIDLTPSQLFERLKHLKNPPKTSQPSVGAFQTLYNQLSIEYDQVAAILLSEKLSGTVSSSEQAAKLVEIPVTTFDSKILTYPMSALLKKGMELQRAGHSLESIMSELETIRDTNETYVLVGSLEQLHRGGRMSGLQFFLGSMLNVKPIISIEDGALSVKEKVRSEKKAKEKILDYFRISYEKYKLKEVYILYGLHESPAAALKAELEEQFPELKVICCPLGAVIGVHAGENTLGISWHNGLK